MECMRCIVIVGDLITGMQKFVTMIGWKDEMVELITKEEGEFKIVSITVFICQRVSIIQIYSFEKFTLIAFET